MTIDNCATIVERGDPDRFLAVMASPVQTRSRLLPLYAFNLEVAKAPWVAKEPMIAEMRLQWWRDVVAEPKSRAHEVAAPLHDLIVSAQLPVEVLDRLVEARRWDIYKDPFADQAAFDAYLEDTGAGLMWLAARALGAADTDETAVRSFGWATALANFLCAVPALEERGRIPLVDGRAAGIQHLASRGLIRLNEARRAGVSKSSRPALLAGWQTEGLLRLAAQDPAAVAEDRLKLSEFAKRGKLLWQSLTGQF
ncbi:phytoene/squalene synthase family protein [Thioclava sp. FR2]|uniref:phytoene/squalene synthase family protein n=1 Tax=Thioclava sp. FR2 TaxID=3445780 RepID=UPI003EBC7338